jgi:hypothetical protein
MPSFMLWNPCVHGDGGGCSFDVRPADFIGLERGTRELMDEFLRDLGIGAEAREWTVTPFCSPYFAPAPDEVDWRDRYPRAWRVRVRFPPGQARPVEPLPWGYLRNEEGIDPTWTEDDDGWEWSRLPGVVIADFAAASFAGVEALDLDLPAVERAETAEFAQGFVQVRFELGTLELPRDAERVEAFLAACRAKALSVHWQNTVHYIASTGQRIP